MADTPESPKPEAAPSDAPVDAARPTRVLVVDDYKDNVEMYAEYLNIAGFEVATADNGQSAVDIAQSQNPDIILMDLSLPLMDGWQAIKKIKQDSRTQNIPVVALTGHGMPTHESRARDAGADDFVVKPALPNDVEDRIRRLLSGAKLGDKKKKSEP